MSFMYLNDEFKTKKENELPSVAMVNATKIHVLNQVSLQNKSKMSVNMYYMNDLGCGLPLVCAFLPGHI